MWGASPVPETPPSCLRSFSATRFYFNMQNVTSCVEEGSKSKWNDGSCFYSHLMLKVTIFTCLVEGKESIKIQFSLFFFLKISLIQWQICCKKRKSHVLKRASVPRAGGQVWKNPSGEDGWENSMEVRWQQLQANKSPVKLPKLACQTLELNFLNACLMQK